MPTRTRTRTTKQSLEPVELRLRLKTPYWRMEMVKSSSYIYYIILAIDLFILLFGFGWCASLHLTPPGGDVHVQVVVRTSFQVILTIFWSIGKEAFLIVSLEKS
jgi:hypothetical protein